MLKPGIKVKVVDDLMSMSSEPTYGECVGLTGTVDTDKVEHSDEPPLYRVILDENQTYYGETVGALYFYAEELEVVNG